ncbi:hypothetical protein [Paenarthrobacter histidinolovorans]|uniref:Uncharacterized protein n=1 Tax=Paenarthrobacter histidinolovorans TaxID=43664 RepID=A0ABW8N4K7_9MICC
MVAMPTLFFLGPVVGAVLVYLFLRMQVWSKPDAESVASHGLWVGIIGWMASSLQGAMRTGIIVVNPTASSATATPGQIAGALSWPVLACLTVHALGQLSYPAPKAPRRYAELTVRRIRDFLPRKLAWTTAGVFVFAALVIAWTATLPGHTPVMPTPGGVLQPSDDGLVGQGQEGRIPGWELAAWLGGALLVLALGTWLVLVLAARRRRLETLDDDDNRALRAIGANRLLRTVATIAAGLAAIAGNFATQPAPGALWQSSSFNVLGLVNMAVLLVMWWWRVPQLPSLATAQKDISISTFRANPRTHGAARLSISIGAALGVVGGLVLVAGIVVILGASRPLDPWAFPALTAVAAMILLATIAAGDMLTARNYGRPEAPVQWPHQPVSTGLLAFAIGSALVFGLAVAFAIAAEVQPSGLRSWLGVLVLSAVVGIAGTLAILAVRRRRGVSEGNGEAGLDAALRAISMYRIVRTLAAYCLGQAAALLLITGDAWSRVVQPAGGEFSLAPSPATTAGMVLAAVAVIVAVVPVRSLLRAIPRGEPAPHAEPAR